ncbi:hypothetical protein [Paenibacillus sedimenti]|uniref:Uncharacterized protein n=1 Tax=Paenibacillus sedimenti TaxID=2770274 RepID=A0A926KWC3_9BACL|nr:hypothetical protein [Paenibacillus sedimenti]MBD0384757.1 hypothetical protein [Paenibacillus sedimenti]
MIQQISDYLFMGSLILLILTLLLKGIGSTGASNAFGNIDLQMQQNHNNDLEKQDTIISKIFKSVFVWISITGIIISIILSKL